MIQNAFGKTGLKVSVLGFGAGHIGGDGLSDGEIERLLNGVLDRGVNLIDTARSYGRSEERIGRFLSNRRGEFVLSSKCGYGVPGINDWTGPCVTAGIEDALRLLRTDRIDIMHLHSCSRDVLERGEVIAALATAKAAGKIAAAAYSGENDALEFALECVEFDSVQTSVNVCDQRVIDQLLPDAGRRGLGVIAKRPLANAFWRFADRPAGNYAEEYWDRARRMQLAPGELAWSEFALRFAAFQPSVHSVIVGTSSLAHLQGHAAAISRGPLPPATVTAIREAFRSADDGWVGQI